MRKLRTLAILASIFAFSACSDDSQSGRSVPSTPEPEDPIVEPQAKAKIGKSCKTLECEEGLFCENDICVAHAKAGESCDKTHVCPTDLVCTNGTCVNEASGEGASCDDLTPCKDELKCVDAVCRQVAPLGGSCENAACDEGSCINGVCAVEVGEGEDCSPEEGKVCAQGFRCSESEQICYRPLEIGAQCGGYEDQCENGLDCHPELEVCMNQGQVGDDCDESLFLACDFDSTLVCIDGKCRQPVENNCSEFYPCESETAVCYDGKCIESHGCTGDSECLADTYCCTEDACTVKGVCLPYGEGPRQTVNEECRYETVPGLFEADVQCEWTHTDDPNQYPAHKNVLMTPLVMNTPHDSGTANEIIFTSYNCTDGSAPSSSGSDGGCYGVIRIINAETCALQESVFDNANRVIGGSNLAMADLDGDGYVEILAG